MKSKTQARTMIMSIKKQAGMTLMEIIAALAIIAAVVVGALALFNSAQSSNLAVSMLKDLTALRSATQQLYQGQGGYGAAGANLNNALVNGLKVPGDMVTNNTVNPATITAPWPGGTVIVAGTANPSRFSITFNAVPRDICVQLIANSATGWFSVATTAGGIVTAFPVSPALASTNCSAAVNNIQWVSSN